MMANTVATFVLANTSLDTWQEKETFFNFEKEQGKYRLLRSPEVPKHLLELRDIAIEHE